MSGSGPRPATCLVLGKCNSPPKGARRCVTLRPADYGMCGITGFWQPKGVEREAAIARVEAMAQAIRHRGPDDSDTWVDATSGVGLGHRRLSIVDLSPEGRQPMTSRSGRYVIVFNGEVYNYRRLREELGQGEAFRGHSDTEVMLAAIERWGLTAATERFIGMFAFALWDKQERTLELVRDRLGIKPLYYGLQKGALIFGSELRALLRFPIERNLNLDAVSALLRTGVIPAPLSIYQGVFKQMPGTILRFSLPNIAHFSCDTYWSAAEVARQGIERPFQGSAEDALQGLDEVLRDAVNLRMIADVPLGAFLSGGIDSSLVVALMQSQATQRVRTFSIGFNDQEFNESANARAVARVLGTDHTELEVDAQQALAVVPKLPGIYDEPFADSSQIPTYLVSSLTRQQVTVALSGDGGDELFGGYNRHIYIPLVWSLARHVPASLRRALARGLHGTSPGALAAAYSRFERLLPNGFRVRIPGEKLKKLGLVLACPDEMAMYERMTVHWETPGPLLNHSTSLAPPGISCPAALSDARSRMMFRDLIDYLPNDILTKVDRASMAVGLEARVPLLDHRVLAYAWRLPQSFKVRGTQGKWILRRLLARYVPQDLFDRPKMGFGIPLASWLRGPLRPWSEAMLDESRLRRDGLLDSKLVRAAWQDHLSGQRDRHHELWILLMLNAWLEAERSGSTQASQVAA